MEVEKIIWDDLFKALRSNSTDKTEVRKDVVKYVMNIVQFNVQQKTEISDLSFVENNFERLLKLWKTAFLTDKNT